jgi:hypothetical protein
MCKTHYYVLIHPPKPATRSPGQSRLAKHCDWHLKSSDLTDAVQRDISISQDPNCKHSNKNQKAYSKIQQGKKTPNAATK